MKLYLDYKKQFNTIILAIVFFLPFVFLHAQTTTIPISTMDIQNKINQNNANIQSLEEEISVYQSQLDSISQQKNSLSGSIQELDLNKKKLDADIAVSQNKIDKTNLIIQNLNSDIGNKTDSVKNDINAIALEIRNTDEAEQTTFLESILSGDSLTAVWNDLNSTAVIEDSLRTDISNLNNTKNDLEGTRQTSIGAKNELIALKSKLADQQKIIIQNMSDKNLLLKQTKNSEYNYQKLLQDRLDKKDAFEKDVYNYEAQLKFILNPASLPQGRVLSWPLEKIYVTQLFGVTKDSKRLYVSGSHNGVDFRASVGTPIMAMADGTVVGIGNTDLTCPRASFGKFVFIQYNNGLSSTYGHLSLIKSKVGDIVKTGDVVGYSGSTGYVTGPHLHVSLYASSAVKMATMPSAVCVGHTYTMPISPPNAYLNVLDYLPPYTINTTILNSTQD